MRTLRARFPVTHGDRGMTLIEVMVAMFVFAILSSVVLATLLQVVSRNRVSELQHVAANLAAEEIELAHRATDLFALTSGQRDAVVNGTTFSVRREAIWVSQDADGAACGTGGGNLRFKRINVTVRWAGMPESMEPVRSDTVVDPAQRLNDPAKGTVLVTVIDAEGLGVADVSVSLTPTTNGAPRSPVKTDSEGCAYLLEVTGGKYTVEVSKARHVGIALESNPQQTEVSVEPGGTASIEFQYDRAASLTATLAPGSAVRLPTNLPLTFVGTYGVATRPVTTSATSTTTRRTFELHPRVTYRVFAGNYGRNTGADCTASDPNAWQETMPPEDAEGTGVEVSLPAGGAAAIDVPMGLVTISGRVRGLRATPAPAAPGNPVCDSTIVHEFGDTAAGSTTVMALPFGTWTLTDRDGAPVIGIVEGNDSATLNVVTLDPREAGS